jgi:predicted cupin superfamily sugar epimerase
MEKIRERGRSGQPDGKEPLNEELLRAMHPRAADLIATLGLEPHPEGGFYREVFRSASMVRPADERGPRSALTTIYFLLTDDTLSRWHRVSSDEAWHLYEGGPLELLELDLSARRLDRHRLALVDASEDRPVHVVHSGNWQAARTTARYALMGCTVSPGFEFADFQMLANDARAADVVRAEWPDLAALI